MFLTKIVQQTTDDSAHCDVNILKDSISNFKNKGY